MCRFLGRLLRRGQPQAPSTGVREAPRHEIAGRKGVSPMRAMGIWKTRAFVLETPKR